MERTIAVMTTSPTLEHLAQQTQLVASGKTPLLETTEPRHPTDPIAPTVQTLESIVASDGTLKSDQYFPIILTFPANTPPPAPDAKTPLTQDEKRSRAIIFSSIALLFIIGLVVFTVTRKKSA